MYSDIWEDGTSSIPASSVHTSDAINLVGFLHTGIFLFGSSVPGGTRFYFEGAGTKEEPTADQWEPLYEAPFKEGEPYLIEKRTGITWVRYRITTGEGGSLTGFTGHIFRKGW